MWFSIFSLLISLQAEPVTVDVPVVEAPFNFLDGSYTAPSMRQSLVLSSAFYESAHRAILGEKKEQNNWRMVGLVAFDVMSTYIPGGNAWLHEEWHRAVMSRRGISSFNDVYNIPIGQSVIAVSHVTDEDLIKLKAEHPAEQVRLSSAGMESQVAQNVFIEKHQFFYEAPDNNRMLLWLNNISVFGYLATCASDEADHSTDEQNANDGDNVPKRDFTGLDCTAWVYDLFRPDEPYTARGVHPSGQGVDRYIRYSDLSAGEKAFLKRQVWLSALNVVDPFLFRFEYFNGRLGELDFKYNARLTHQLTSFGYSVNAHLFLKTEAHRFEFVVHNGFNDKSYFPGFTLGVIGEPLTEKLDIGGGFTLWSQPDGQRFDSRGGSLLTSALVELGYRVRPDMRLYMGVDGKTPGWMTGQVFLDRALTTYAGMSAQVF